MSSSIYAVECKTSSNNEKAARLTKGHFRFEYKSKSHSANSQQYQGKASTYIHSAPSAFALALGQGLFQSRESHDKAVVRWNEKE